MPSAWAAMPMRPPSSVAIATAKPCPSSCNSRSRPTSRVFDRQVRGRGRVEAELLLLAGDPHLVAVEDECGDPFAPRCLRVGSREEQHSACEAAVRDPLLRARDRPAVAGRDRSRPERSGVRAASGSVSAKAPTLSPRASGGTNRLRCSSVPKVRIGKVTALVCTATVTPTPASARESSSRTRMYKRKSAPAPPYSSGMQTPSNPSAAELPDQLSAESRARGPRSKRWARSPPARTHAPAIGSPAGRR